MAVVIIVLTITITAITRLKPSLYPFRISKPGTLLQEYTAYRLNRSMEKLRFVLLGLSLLQDQSGSGKTLVGSPLALFGF